MKTEDPLYSAHPHAQSELTKKDGQFAILALTVDDGGCGWYRVRQHLNKMKQMEGVSTVILNGKETGEELIQAIQIADVIISRNGTLAMAKKCKQDFGSKIIFDVDDRLDLIAPSNEHYADHGIEDVAVERSGKIIPVWEHGVTPGFDKFENRHKLVDFQEHLELADLVTVTTRRLAEYYDQFNYTDIIPNLIDFDLYRPHVNVSDTSKPKDRLHIGWSGGASHHGDFREIAAPLTDIVNKNDVIYHTVGYHFKKMLGDIDPNKLKAIPWMPFKAHPMNLKLLDLDIGIIPLERINEDETKDFNVYKSGVKWYEMAALGIPTLVRRMAPYTDDIEEDVTALMYDTPEEFKERLERLLKDTKLRLKLKKNAYEWVYENRNLDKWLPRILDIYQNVTNGKV